VSAPGLDLADIDCGVSQSPEHTDFVLKVFDASSAIPDAASSPLNIGAIGI
jgi:hypothetical protein